MFRKLRARIVLGVLSVVVSLSVYSAIHLIQIDEVYSNADGTVQFVELSMFSAGQTQFNGFSLTSTQGGTTNTLVFNRNVTNGANGAKILIGTQGYAALPGVPPPDFVVPNGFVFTTNVTIFFSGSSASAFFGAVPVDGTLSIAPSGATATNSPTNNAGQSGMVVISNPTPPGAPSIGLATPGNAQASIAFTPGTAGSSPTIDFAATCTSTGQTTRTGTAVSSPITITSLTNGSIYSCTVTAQNSNGTSGSSGPVNVTPIAPVTTPGAPTINLISPGNAQATISFSAPASDGGAAIDNYIANCSGAQSSGPTSPITVTGLINGNTYSCTVTAHNSVGNGPASSAAFVTPDIAPAATTINSAVPGNGQATISFTTAANGGSAINNNVVSCTPNGAAAGPSSPITVMGLTNGTPYSCTVTAFNGAGAGPASLAASVTPRTVPSAPTIGVATRGNTSASITFTPGANGGSAVNLFTATCNPGNISGIGPTSPVIVSGLTNGTVYTCNVNATNAAGTGAASATVSVVPATLPGAPTITGTIPGDAQATVNFTPPASNGGAAITSYAASCSSPITIGSGSPITVTPLANDVLVSCIVTATNAVGTGAASVAVPATPSAMSPLTPIAVYARKIHGALGPFDLRVDTASGSVTSEPRFIGNGHTIVFAFNVPINDPGTATLTVTPPVGMVAVDKSGYEVVTTLTGIPDNQRATVTLTGVNGNGLTVTANLGFLVGDVNNSQAVNASDISGVKARSGQTTNLQNFKFDLNATGAISPADVSAVKARSGLVLSP